MPRKETSGSELSSQVLSLGSFLGLRRWGPVRNAGGKGKFRNLCARSSALLLPTGRSRPLLQTPQAEARTPWSFRESNISHSLCCLPFSLPVPPRTWCGETSCSQKSSDPQTLRSQTQKTNEEAANARIAAAAVTAKAFGGLPSRSRCPCKWQGSGAGRLGSSCLFSGQVFWSFQVSLSLSAK